MAVAFDAVGAGLGVSSATSPLTWNHTCGATATHLLVGVHVDQPSGAAPTVAVTYNAVSMGAPVATQVTNTSAFVYIYAMLTPPTGSAHAVNVTVTGGSGFDAIIGGSVSFTGSAGLGTPAAGGSVTSTTTPSLSVPTSTATGMIYAVDASGDQINSDTTPATSRWNDNFKGPNGNTGGNANGLTSPGTGSAVTVAWGTNSAPYAIAAIEVTVAGGAAPPTAGPSPAFLILEQYGFVPALFQQPPLTSTAVNVTPTAQAAAVTVAANTPIALVTGLDPTGAAVAVAALAPTLTTSTTPTAGLASVTVSSFPAATAAPALPSASNVPAAGLDANNPQVGAQPDTPTVTVGALAPTLNIQGDGTANAGTANVNAAAFAAGLTISTSPTSPANVTVAANNPTGSVTGGTVITGAAYPLIALIGMYGTAIFPTPITQSGTNDTALPQSTAVTVASYPALPLVTVTPGVATVTAAALTVTQQVAITLPATPNVAVAALPASPLLNALPDTPNVTAAALTPSVTTGGNITVFPGIAAVTVVALNPSTASSASPTAGVAAVTVAAIGPAANVGPTLQAAAVVIAAFAARPTVTGTPPAASVLCAAIILAVSGTGDRIGTLTARASEQSKLSAGSSSQTTTSGGDR